MKRGFTLLEVMVAMAILALGLTTVLSSQTGLFSTTRRVQFETEATSLVRCKMSEIELELLQKGYPLIDQNDSGECCEDEDSGRFRCEWTIETVQLPQPVSFSDDVTGDGDGDDADADLATGDLSATMPTTGGGLDGVGSLEDLAGGLAPTSGASGGGMVGMALGLVYPTLKPMLEASIRKVRVKVLWDEGHKERSFEVIQYVTDPREGSLNPNAAEGVDDLVNMLNGGTTTGSGTTGSSSSSSTSGGPLTGSQ